MTFFVSSMNILNNGRDNGELVFWRAVGGAGAIFPDCVLGAGVKYFGRVACTIKGRDYVTISLMAGRPLRSFSRAAKGVIFLFYRVNPAIPLRGRLPVASKNRPPVDDGDRKY